MTPFDRRSGIGASEVAAACGLDKWCSRYALWERKTGRAPEKKDSDAMALGHALEAWVLAKWLKMHPAAEQISLQERRHWVDMIWATLDLLASDDSGVIFPVDAKTTTWRNDELGEEGTDQLPVYWLCQMQVQMASVGASHGHVAVLVDGREYRDYRVKASLPVADQIAAKCREFWRYVESDTLPPSSWAEPDETLDRYRWVEDLGEIADLSPVAYVWGEYESLGRQITAIKKQRAELEQRVLAAMGDHRRGTLGNGRELIIKEVERDGYMVQPTSYMRLFARKEKR